MRDAVFGCFSIFFAAMTAVGSAAGPLKGDLGAHDPSTIVKCKNRYWLFATGKGIISKHSKNLVDWEPGPPVFSGAPPAWTGSVAQGFEGFFWAPDIIQRGRQYFLYYSVSMFGVNTSAIGLATNTTLDPADRQYKWVDQGLIIQSRRQDNFNAIDPCVIADSSGKLWLAFGSFWSGIKMIELNSTTGKRIAPDSPIHSLAHNDTIEAPFLYRQGSYYYLFVNWGLCCKGVNSTYNIRVGRSAKITGPYLDKAGMDMQHKGGTLFLDSQSPFIGPGHAGILNDLGKMWLSYHYYEARANGRPTLNVVPLRWGADGWPVAEAGVQGR